ncbi:protein PFF0380w [Bicyclus anynana]|uniref:Protein PFF0380w n=1 Tax=Bicyclus anynana TaxID=110368 RepID=A0A6J1NPA7_BICAN|nr:protein PFF0380w [Bicyclus anynana]
MTTEQKFDCIFCQESFEDKETLQIHFRKHGDPKFNQSTKTGKSRSQNESPTAERSGEESEMVECDVCEEVFLTISKAITHKHKAHPDHDSKYFCPFCGKLFTMKHLLNKHIQSNHNLEVLRTSKEFHCDMCSVTFNVPSAMLYHNKFFHRQDTEIPAIGTSKKIKLFNQEMLQVYYCSFCGEEFHNKVNLHKHVSEDHCDENQSPNEVLRCPLCEAIFYHLDAYEIHLMFHSSEDVYSEKNELVDQITEFSLETVAPIMEKVEEEAELDTQPEDEGINNFLQLVMGDQTDNVSMEKVKHKKHKKHKKSKKASITLDEFLNMNKDVFGDGLGDVQGIEEVPTQVVLKKVKAKAPARNDAKIVNADLAKLKKHGIIVKTKPKHNASVKSLNISKAKQLISGGGVNNKNIMLQKSPNDILSKLLNQGNSQIKIVKKSAAQSTNNEQDSTSSVVSDAISNPSEPNTPLPSDGEKDCETDLKSNILETPLTNELCKESNAPDETENEVHTEMSSPVSNCKDIISHNQMALENEETKALEKICESKFVNSDLASNPCEQQDETKSNEIEKCSVTEVHDSDKVNDESHHYNDSKKEIETNNANKTPLSALKHLSHLTVKPLASQKNIFQYNRKEELTVKENLETDNTHNSTKQDTFNKILKSCGQVTVKKANQNVLNTSGIESDEEIDQEYNDDLENDDINHETMSDLKHETTNINRNNKNDMVEMKEPKLELVPLSQSICDIYLSNKNNGDELDNLTTDQQTTKEKKEEQNLHSSKETSNLDILKRLTNVTAKPLNIAKVSNQYPSCVKVKQNFVPAQQKNISKGIDKEIEVFNIDDSDEETDGDTLNNTSEVKSSGGVSNDVLKNLSRNITIKSNEMKTVPNNMNKNINLQTSTMRSDSYSESFTQIKQSKEIQKSLNLQNKLKTLGNITVKSSNSSPNVCNKSYEDYEDEQGESGSDNETLGRVKITEVNEDDMSDGDLNEQHSNAVVESPNASNSEYEDNQDDFNDDLPDFENHIKMTTLQKNEVPIIKKAVPHLDNLKNLNKTLTIKPINTKNVEQAPNAASNREVSEGPKSTTQEMALKPYKPNVPQTEHPLNKNIHQPSGSSNQTSFNQKVNTASNQVKTVNTVKRFQSQTVIEEITTTVTKTIRTVNSSTNEVMQSTAQQNKPINRPQKILNKPPGKGTAIRHLSPTIGTKIRNAVPVARSPNTTIVRPSNQVVPVRPVFNRPRFPAPSILAVRKVVPPRCSPQRPAIGRLKISPNALAQSNKRPSDESLGNFSAFKKPKDMSPSKELADFSDDDSPMQYASTSQTRSDFSSVTKKAKGFVTATQTRSEVNMTQQQISKGVGSTQVRSEVSMSSQQQLSRLNNMSGLKVVKTSSKQMMQVEERCEMSPGKRNTLEALEKLQRQGLLVKKPRIEEQGHAFSESDEEMDEQ